MNILSAERIKRESEVLPTRGGIDFGFSNPFASVWGHLDYDECLWITGGRYVRQCTTPVHAESIPKGVLYFCDPAQPESRVELIHAGHECLPCLHIAARGAGGEKRSPILHGIDLVSARIASGRLRVIRNEGTKWLIREAAMYSYDPEKTSENPIDSDNHAMDALRYLIVGLDRGKVAEPSFEEFKATIAKEKLDDLARSERELVDEQKRFVRLDRDAQSNIDDPRWKGSETRRSVEH